MADLDPVSPIGVWNAILTILVGIIGWNWTKLTDKVDGKAEAARVDELERRMDDKADKPDIDAVRREIEALRRSQELQHQETRVRLDRILENQADRAQREMAGNFPRHPG